MTRRSQRTTKSRNLSPAPGASGADSSWRRFGLLVVLVVVCTAGITLAISMFIPGDPQPVDRPPPGEPIAIAHPFPWPESPFENTRQGTYVGSDKCIECHADEHEGYRRTGMGRSLAVLDPSREPPDAVIPHPHSGRNYEVVRQDGKMRHRELIVNSQGKSIVLNDHPVAYVIGSGNHARGYLIEIDGFLVESPLTWYESRRAWDMSPGYDTPQHMGFQRPVDQGCLVCHVGSSRPLDGSFHRMEISEATISCERCHGPGSLHVARQEGQTPTSKPGGSHIDHTIVNPAHLSRELADDVCAQCHLRSVASCLVRDRDLSDFRPGIPLAAVRTEFHIGTDNDPMSVVGHVQQMRASACYQASQMTCTACHDPHHQPAQEQRVEYYRSKCLNCHDLAACDVDPQQRVKFSADNDCTTCHMPTAPIDIPHLAFTHHRIGIHDLSPANRPQPPELTEAVSPTALVDLSSWSEADQARTLGSAYLELSQSQAGVKFGKEYQQRSLDLLASAWDMGLREPDLAAKLAQFTSVVGDARAIHFAEFVLSHDRLPARLRGNALLAKADWHKRRREFTPAAAAVRELTRLRRSAADWVLLAEMEQLAGNQPAAIAAAEKAVEIDPFRADLRRALIDVYRREGNAERTTWHEERIP